MPEVLTETEQQPAQASNADLNRMTQAHYEKVSRAAHEWNSAIPKAIDAYYADPERERLRDQVIEAAKKWRRDMTHKSDAALVAAVDSLTAQESK